MRHRILLVLAILATITGTAPGAEAQTPAAEPSCTSSGWLHGVNYEVTDYAPADAIDFYRNNEFVFSLAATGKVDPMIFSSAGGQIGVVYVLFVVIRSGDSEVVVPCGEAMITPELPTDEFSCSVELGPSGLPIINDDFKPEHPRSIYRNGRLLDDYRRRSTEPFIDFSAVPGATYHYELRFTPYLQPHVTVPCGTITVDEIDEIAMLEQASDQAADTVPDGPYRYARATLICPDEASCPREPIDLGPGDFVTVDLGGLLPLLPDGHPGYEFPAHGILIQGLRDGADVSYELDDRGVPMRWTVNGFGLAMTCFEADMAPPELRLGPCGTRFDETRRLEDAVTLRQVMAARDFTPEAADVLRLYNAFLGRYPDAEGAKYWIQLERSGTSLDAIADEFVVSREAELRFGAESDGEFLDRVYRNMFDRVPDSGGHDYWLAELGHGLSRTQLVRWVSGGVEFAERFPYDDPRDVPL